MRLGADKRESETLLWLRTGSGFLSIGGSPLPIEMPLSILCFRHLGSSSVAGGDVSFSTVFWTSSVFPTGSPFCSSSSTSLAFFSFFLSLDFFFFFFAFSSPTIFSFFFFLAAFSTEGEEAAASLSAFIDSDSLSAFVDKAFFDLGGEGDGDCSLVFGGEGDAEDFLVINFFGLTLGLRRLFRSDLSSERSRERLDFVLADPFSDNGRLLSEAE